MNRYLYYIIVASTLLVSCRSSKQEKTDDGHSSPAQEYSSASSLENASIAPGYCRIVGTVVHIDSILDLTDKSSPCSKAPCLASVKVDSIIGYGSSFIEPLSTGDTVFIKFMFTLSPTTKELFPDMKGSYPGLLLGSQFIGDISSQVQMKNYGMKNIPFLVYTYKRL